MTEQGNNEAINALSKALEAKAEACGPNGTDNIILWNNDNDHSPGPVIAEGIKLGAFNEKPQAMLLSDQKIHEYRLVAFSPEWTLGYVHATRVEEGSTTIDVEQIPTAAIAIRQDPREDTPRRDRSLSDEARVHRIISDLTHLHRQTDTVVVSILWHQMDHPNYGTKVGDAAARTLAKALTNNKEPFNPSTGGDRAYRVDYQKLEDGIWLATAHRLRPVLLEGRLNPEIQAAAQYLLSPRTESEQ